MDDRPQDVHREALRRAGDQDDYVETFASIQDRVAVAGEGRADPEANQLPRQETCFQIYRYLTYSLTGITYIFVKYIEYHFVALPCICMA